MSEQDKLKGFWRELEDLLPNDLRHLGEDLKTNLRVIISAALTRANVVSREEYDDQVRQLTRVRDSMEELEERLATLERQKTVDTTGNPGTDD